MASLETNLATLDIPHMIASVIYYRIALVLQVVM